MKPGDIWSPGSRSIYIHDSFKTFAGDFGDPTAKQAWFCDPLLASPWGGPGQVWDKPLVGNPTFNVLPGGGLRISSYFGADGNWHSGMINSVSADGLRGRPIPAIFACEVTMRLPDTTSGVSVRNLEPSIWLNTITGSNPHFQLGDYPVLEINVMECFSNNPFVWSPGVHTRTTNDIRIYNSQQVSVTGPSNALAGDLTTNVHAFGVDAGFTEIVFFYDRIVVLVVPRDPNARLDPFALMAGTAVGGEGFGFPGDNTKTYTTDLLDMTVYL